MNEDADPLTFLQAFFSDLLGRYAHLLQFVDQIRREARYSPPNLVVAYRTALHEAMNELVEYGGILKEENIEKDKQKKKPAVEEYFGPFIFFLRQSAKFQDFHKGLSLLATPWPETEVFQFLKQLFDENRLLVEFESLNPSLVYSDDFNFLTYDFRRYLPPKVGPRLAVWALPKAESINPLFWPVLAHEVAHSLFVEADITKAVHDVIASSSTEDQNTINAWSVEFNADYFAYRMLGPAYIYSMMYFSMFFITDQLRHPMKVDGRISKLTYPPPQLRVALLMEEFESCVKGQTEDQRKVKERFEQLKSIYDYRLKFDHQRRTFMEDPPVAEQLVRQIWQIIKEMQKDAFRELKSDWFDAELIESSCQLTRNIEDGLVSASIREPKQIQEVRAWAASSDDERQMANKEKLLMNLTERPARMLEILNAGWMAKVDEMMNGSLFSSILDASKTRTIVEILTTPARQLRKSIQVALILSSIRRSQ